MCIANRRLKLFHFAIDFVQLEKDVCYYIQVNKKNNIFI